MQRSILKNYIGLFSLVFLTLSAFAQNRAPSIQALQYLKVGAYTAADASAAVDIASITKGLLVPRMTETQRDAISSPATGLMVFNTDDAAFNYWDGDSWEGIGGGVTLAAVGSSSNANGATLAAGVLNLEPASASHPGVVTTGTQTMAGTKTFSGNVNIGGTSYFAGRVRIGTSSGGTGALKVKAIGSDWDNALSVESLTNSHVWALYPETNGNLYLRSYTGSATAMVWDTGGRTTFGAGSPLVGSQVTIGPAANLVQLTLKAHATQTDPVMTLQNNGGVIVGQWEKTGALGIGGTATSSTVPGLYFVGDTNTGVSRSASDTLNLVAGGVTALAVDGSTALTTKGSIPYVNSSGILAALGVGTTGYVATMDTTGLPAWKAPPSGGVKNYLGTVNGVNGNGDFELCATTGWTLGTTGTLTNGIPTGSPTFGSGASGNLSLSSVTLGNQLAGTCSLGYSSSAATTAGNMVASSAFTIDKSDKAKLMTVSFDYEVATNPTNGNFSGTSSNSYAWAMWDATNSSWIPPTGGFCMTQSSGTGTCTGTFQTSASGTSYRYVFYNANATAGAQNLGLDNFSLSRQTAPSGAPHTDWQAYTPTLTGFGTPSGVEFEWRRDGDSVQIRGKFTSGTSTAVEGRVSLPNGLIAADITRIPSLRMAGTFGWTQTTNLMTGVLMEPNVGYVTFGYGDAGVSSVLSKKNGSGVLSSGNGLSINISTIPIAGWSSNVQMSSDSDTRVVSFRGTQTSEAVTAGVTNIAFTAAKDSHAAWNGTQYVVSVAGDYLLSVNLTSSAATTPAVYKNGVVVGAGNTTNAATHSATGTVLITGCVPGDLISVRSSVSVTITSGVLGIFRLSGPATIAASETVSMKYNNTAGTSVANAGDTIIPFAVKAWDTHNAYNTSTGLYTCPVSGKYRVTAALNFASATYAAGNQVHAVVYKNGAAYAYSGAAPAWAAITTTTGANLSTVVDCLVGDTLAIWGQNTRTAGATTLSTVATVNHMEIERIGN